MKTCDIVIPVWNEPESTKKCLKNLKENTRHPYRLIVVDNGSDDETKRYLEGLDKEFKDYVLIRNSRNLGFVKAVNQGMVTSKNPYICLLNNDAYVEKDWLFNLVETAEGGAPDIGIANPSSNAFGNRAPDGKVPEYQELDSCKGFCMLIKKEVLDKVGLFDEAYAPGYFEEKDFSRKALEAGYICIRAKASYVFHRDRLSFDKLTERDAIFKRNERIFNERWGRQRNLAFIVEKKEAFADDKSALYELLKKGDRVHIFFRRNRRPADLKDHINIKYMALPDIFFNYAVIFKLWKRRRKKKIESIATESESAFKFYRKFKFAHGANVLKHGEF